MRRYALFAALFALSCRKSTPAAPTRPPHAAHASDAALTPHHASDASSANADAAGDAEVVRVVPRVTPPPGPPRPDGGATRRTSTARVTAPNADDPWALVSAPGGALWVRAVNHEGQRVSEIVATVMNRDGVALGAPRLVRRTTGPVRALSVDAVGPHVWVAWHTVRSAEDSDRQEHIVAAIHGDADLSAVSAPVTLANFSYVSNEDLPYRWDRPTARVFVRDDGGALVVSTGARAVCVHGESEEHTERVPCEGWNVTRVELTGEKRVDGNSVLCAVDVPSGFVRVPGGIAYAVRDDHVGTKLFTYTESLGAQAAVPNPLSDELWHYGDPSMAWGDGVFAMRASFVESDGGDTAPEGVFVRGASAAARTPELHDQYGGVVLPRIDLSPLRCVGGHPVARVRWDHGSSSGVVFDPTHAGTSIELARWAEVSALALPSGVTDAPSSLVWAGNARVGVSGARLMRWTCERNGSLRLASE